MVRTVQHRGQWLSTGTGLPNLCLTRGFRSFTQGQCGQLMREGSSMPDQTDALTRLVREHVGDGKRLTVRAFAALAIDPTTGTTISKSTAGNLVLGHWIKITPGVLGAIAAGLGEPPMKVQVAAMKQYVGLVIDDPFDTPAGDSDVVVRVAHEPGKNPDEMPAVRAFLREAERRD